MDSDLKVEEKTMGSRLATSLLAVAAVLAVLAVGAYVFFVAPPKQVQTGPDLSRAVAVGELPLAEMPAGTRKIRAVLVKVPKPPTKIDPSSNHERVEAGFAEIINSVTTVSAVVVRAHCPIPEEWQFQLENDWLPMFVFYLDTNGDQRWSQGEHHFVVAAGAQAPGFVE